MFVEKTFKNYIQTRVTLTKRQNESFFGVVVHLIMQPVK